MIWRSLESSSHYTLQILKLRKFLMGLFSDIKKERNRFFHKMSFNIYISQQEKQLCLSSLSSCDKAIIGTLYEKPNIECTGAWKLDFTLTPRLLWSWPNKRILGAVEAASKYSGVNTKFNGNFNHQGYSVTSYIYCYCWIHLNTSWY